MQTLSPTRNEPVQVLPTLVDDAGAVVSECPLVQTAECLQDIAEAEAPGFAFNLDLVGRHVCLVDGVLDEATTSPAFRLFGF
jgi:hypothetical protein